MPTNYALPGNPNETMTRSKAVDYLVDCCLNVEDFEWSGCSVMMKSKDEAIKDIKEVAALAFVLADESMIDDVHSIIWNDDLMNAIANSQNKEDTHV